MIVDDCDVVSAGIGPSETHVKLIIDPKTMLSFPVAFKRFQTIPGWHAKVFHPPRDFQLPKRAARHRGKTGKPLYRTALRQGFRIGTPEGFDHRMIIT